MDIQANMVHIQANTSICAKSSIKSTCHWRKLYQWLSLLIIILKEMAYNGGYIVDFFNPPKKNLPAEKCYTDEWDCYSI